MSRDRSSVTERVAFPEPDHGPRVGRAIIAVAIPAAVIVRATAACSGSVSESDERELGAYQQSGQLDELAGVMAHEIGHVVRRHSVTVQRASMPFSHPIRRTTRGFSHSAGRSRVLDIERDRPQPSTTEGTTGGLK